MPNRFPRVLALGISMLAVAGLAAAQPAFSTMPMLKANQKILVSTDGSVTPVEGHVVGRGADVLNVRMKDRFTSILIKDITRIETPTDRVSDGAAKGAIGLGVWCALVCGQGLDRAGDWPKAVLAAAGWGALIGAAIDAAHRHRTVIYRRPSVALLVTPSPGARAVVNMRIMF